MKVLLSILFVCLPLNVFSQNGNSGSGLPVIELPKFQTVKLEQPFRHAVGGNPVHERTNIWMRYDEIYLEIHFDCLDNPFVNQNFYTENNSPLFHQEVLEVFINNGNQPQEQYIEIQINPNNAVFLAKINFGFKSDSAYSAELINPVFAGIISSVVKDAPNEKWSGFLKIPLQLIQYPIQPNEDRFRINIFRIISKENQTSKDWRCTEKNATFACWSSPLCTKPQFHKPDRFGFLILK
ncbi:MAG: carbohydrate-binding family 9-like protein [Bacteroidales bacterium]|nr:carbohydrate-binding family 9-like protein [Bacteroidales bacterium]